VRLLEAVLSRLVWLGWCVKAVVVGTPYIVLWGCSCGIVCRNGIVLGYVCVVVVQGWSGLSVEVGVGGIGCVAVDDLRMVCVWCHCVFLDGWSSVVCGVICEVNGCGHCLVGVGLVLGRVTMGCVFVVGWCWARLWPA